MDKDCTASNRTIPPTSATENVGRLQVSAYSEALRQDFDTPLNKAREGETVTVTVAVASLRRTPSGRATGAVTGDGGSAIVTIPRDAVARLAPVMTPGAQVTVRGTVEIVAGIPTIRVTAVRAVA